MCLDRLDPKVRPRKVGGKIYAWKAFCRFSGGRLYFLCQPDIGVPERGLTKGRWMCESDYRPPVEESLRANEGGGYPMGFHAYANGNDARWRGPAFRVELRNIVATGWQDGRKVVVAKRMKILPEKKRGK